MDPKISKITESEAEVLRVLWAAGRELSVTDIIKALKESSRWESSTIKTLLRRLCEKGVVSAAKRDIFYYSAVISEGEYSDYTTRALIDRLYSGSARNLVASLIGSSKLDDKDIAELRSLLKGGKKDE